MGLQDDIDRVLAEEAAKKEAERLARETRQQELAAYPVILVSQEVRDYLLEFTQIMRQLNISPLSFVTEQRHEVQITRRWFRRLGEVVYTYTPTQYVGWPLYDQSRAIGYAVSTQADLIHGSLKEKIMHGVTRSRPYVIPPHLRGNDHYDTLVTISDFTACNPDMGSCIVIQDLDPKAEVPASLSSTNGTLYGYESWYRDPDGGYSETTYRSTHEVLLASLMFYRQRGHKG